MIPQSLASSGFRPRPKTTERSRSTAFYIFDETQTHLYKIDHAHFMAKNKRFNVPMVTTGKTGDMERIAEEMLAITGTIWDMVEQFVDGARISIEDNKVAALIYQRILAHFEYHSQAMKTEKMYVAPDVEDFRNMAEFATCIRPWALMGNPDVEASQVTQVKRFFPTRASFSNVDIEERKTDVIPKSVKQMDNIERWLEMSNGG